MISIIGAGPVGSYLAYLLAKNNKEVGIFEEHGEVGEPVQCTGIVTSSLANFVKLNNKFVVNKIKRLRVVAPDKNNIELKLKKSNIVLDRKEFDNHLIDKAVDEGAKLFLGHKFLDFYNNEVIFNSKKVKTDVLVGADGALSSVSQKVFSYRRKYFKGFQARVKGKYEKDLTEIYLGLGNFIWVVPENEDIARVGVVDRNNVGSYLRNFLKKRKGKILDYQGGLIPIFDPRFRAQRNNVFLVGDAAGMVKATSHGGILQGLMAAEELNKAIINNNSYENLWRKRLEKDLKSALFIKKVLDKFSKEDYNYLVNLCAKSKVKNILEDYDRDFISRFLWKVVLKEPRFLRFLGKVF